MKYIYNKKLFACALAALLLFALCGCGESEEDVPCVQVDVLNLQRMYKIYSIEMYSYVGEREIGYGGMKNADGSPLAENEIAQFGITAMQISENEPLSVVLQITTADGRSFASEIIELGKAVFGTKYVIEITAGNDAPIFTKLDN